LATSGVILIAGEDVAWRLLCDVDAGKEDEGAGLLLNAKRYGPFLGGLGQILGCCWATVVHQISQVSLSLSFSLFNFCFIFSVLYLLFEFKIESG
jgi:hypothetical protein